MTSGTCGLRSIGSSASAALSACLANRLQAAMQISGSTLYRLIWRPWTAPSGVCRFRLRASVPRTSATAPTGWPTPTTRDWKDGYECLNVPLNALLGRVVWLAGWPTPKALDEQMARHSREAAVRFSERPRKSSELGIAVLLTEPMRITASGERLTGSCAGMESGGHAVCPRFPRRRDGREA